MKTSLFRTIASGLCAISVGACSLSRDVDLPAYKIMAAMNGANDPLPQTLSQTHLFEEGDPNKPSFGLVLFDVKASLWTDGAHKKRYIFVPPDKKVSYDSSSDKMTYPIGTTVAKSFTTEAGEPIETRVMTLKNDNKWSFGTYVWKDGESNLSLNPVTVTAGDGQNYRVPSEKECRLCHNEAMDPPVIGFSTAQLNASTEEKKNFLDSLADQAIFEEDVETIKAAPSIPDPRDETIDLNTRARAYLAINCGTCHRPNGPAIEQKFDLRFSRSREETGLIANNIVVPHKPDESLMWQKYSAVTDRMPPLSVRHDPLGMELIKAWIEKWPQE